MTHYLPNFIKIAEPKLLFGYSDKLKISINPIEGLLQWGPYDKSIPNYLSSNEIRLAVITTPEGFDSVIAHLNSLKSKILFKGKDEYLKDYIGFENIYKTKLTFPQKISDSLVNILADSEIETVSKETSPEIAFLNLIKRKLSNFISEKHSFDIIIIHIPSNLSVYTSTVSEKYSYDLHDAIKAYSAPNSLKIQIIQDNSINSYEPARIAWWLSLALYVKANGIPWKLDKKLDRTAYVGLAYGIKKTDNDKKIVIGCSQIFDESGEGLKFLLFPIKNPIWIGKNPFMNTDDSRKLFQIIKKTYQDLNQCKPNRIVVHKTIHYLDNEVKGIIEALEGIEDVELLTLENTCYKAIQSEPSKNDQSKREVSGWPILRGTALPLDKSNFLLWTQGDVLGVSGQNRHYFKEKRNIPSPIIVNKTRGKMELNEIAEDILKLTKMNWNNLEFYNRDPVTISFAQTISEIVKQLDECYEVPYDFRYFI